MTEIETNKESKQPVSHNGAFIGVSTKFAYDQGSKSPSKKESSKSNQDATIAGSPGDNGTEGGQLYLKNRKQYLHKLGIMSKNSNFVYLTKAKGEEKAAGTFNGMG